MKFTFSRGFGVGRLGTFSSAKPSAVFSFEDPIDFLNFEVRKRRSQNPKFSLRSWARQLGYTNPSYLSQVLKRQRKLKPELAGRIAESLNLDGSSRRYFDIMVLSSSAGDGAARSTYNRVIRKFRPKPELQQNQIRLELFTLMAEWYHVVIGEMPQLAGFQSSEKYIRERLGRSVDLRTIREAIDRLVTLGFLKRSENGTLTRNGEGNYTYDPNTAQEALRTRTRHWIEAARQALVDQRVDERDFYCTTLSFRRENLPRVKEILREAHRQVQILESTQDGEEIYQLNTQFFRVTTPIKGSKK